MLSRDAEGRHERPEEAGRNAAFDVRRLAENGADERVAAVSCRRGAALDGGKAAAAALFDLLHQRRVARVVRIERSDPALERATLTREVVQLHTPHRVSSRFGVRRRGEGAAAGGRRRRENAAPRPRERGGNRTVHKALRGERVHAAHPEGLPRPILHRNGTVRHPAHRCLRRGGRRSSDAALRRGGGEGQRDDRDAIRAEHALLRLPTPHQRQLDGLWLVQQADSDRARRALQRRHCVRRPLQRHLPRRRDVATIDVDTRRDGVLSDRRAPCRLRLAYRRRDVGVLVEVD